MTFVPDDAFLVREGWERSVFVRHTLGPSYRLLFWPDGVIGFEHRCDRGDRGVIICAPALTNVDQPGGHQVSWDGDVVTISPSILCPDCGTHGFIRAGRWVEA